MTLLFTRFGSYLSVRVFDFHTQTACVYLQTMR